jgi:hypothetical protein
MPSSKERTRTVMTFYLERTLQLGRRVRKRVF